jgi:hypothetical protein
MSVTSNTRLQFGEKECKTAQTSFRNLYRGPRGEWSNGETPESNSCPQNSLIREDGYLILVTTITALLIASDYAHLKMPARTKALVVATAGAAIIGVAIYANLQIHAGLAERTASLPGDELIPNPVGVVNHAITIHRPPHDVWPWLAQMGSGRAGWYSYDFIDNGGIPSSKHILPEYQNVAVGTVFPALPGAKDVFVVVRCEPEHREVSTKSRQFSRIRVPSMIVRIASSDTRAA